MNVNEGLKRTLTVAYSAVILTMMCVTVYLIEWHSVAEDAGVTDQLGNCSLGLICAAYFLGKNTSGERRLGAAFGIYTPIYWLFLFGSFFGNKVYFSWPMYWLGFIAPVLILWLCLETFSYIAEGFLQKK